MRKRRVKTDEEKELEELKWMDIVSELVDNYKINETIPHEVLRAKFEATTEDINTDEVFTTEFYDIDELRDMMKTIDFKYMSFMNSVWTTAIKKFRLLIINIKGQGYKFVDANEQTKIAVNDLDYDLKKAFSKCVLILENVRVEELNNEKRKENSDAIAHVSQKRQILKSNYKSQEN